MGEEEPSLSVALSYAIDAGIAARDVAREISVPRVRSRWNHVIGLKAILGWFTTNAEIQPSGYVVHRAARLLDEFATELGTLQTLVADFRLEPIVMRAGGWGERVWRDDDEAPLVFEELAPALDLLYEYRTNLTLGRPIIGPR